MGQKIHLSEKQLRNIIKESVNKALNEVSDSTLTNAMGRSEDLNRDLNKINQQFQDLDSSLSDLTGIGFSNDDTRNKEIEKIYYAFTGLWDRFKQLYARKQSQYDNFQDEFQRRGQPEVD